MISLKRVPLNYAIKNLNIITKTSNQYILDYQYLFIAESVLIFLLVAAFNIPTRT